jgi:RNA polymerase primary sigma factor
LELRRELLAIALLEPASDRELERIASELELGRLRTEAVVDEPGLSTPEVRARFAQFHARLRGLRRSGSASWPSSDPLAAAASDRPVEAVVPPPPEAVLGSVIELAQSLRLEWALVDRVLQNSWVHRARSAHRAAAPVLPEPLARRVAQARTEVDSIIERLVTTHQGLVSKVARRYRGLGLRQEDLMQDGNIGLLRAIEKFDAQRGKPFAAYAVWWVRHAIRHAIAVQARTIRLPASALARRFALGRASNRLAQELGRDPSRQELSTATGVTPESIGDVMRMSKEPLSLDAPRSPSNDLTIGDALCDPLARSPHEGTWARELAAELRSLFEALSPRERYVLSLRFGLGDSDEHTLEAIGDTLGLTRERIRQIVATALDKLNQATRGRELQP